MMRNLDELANIIKKLIDLTSSLIALESEKLEAAQKNLVTFIEDSMNKEQAAILKLKGLDKSRELALKNLGFDNLSFQELLVAVTEEEHRILEPLFLKLNENYKVLKSTTNSAMEIMQTNLHVIESTLSGQSAANTYSPQKTSNSSITKTKL